MPHARKDHVGMQLSVCAVCFRKPKTLRGISAKVKISIQEEILPEFDSEPWSWLPTVICGTCYKDLRDHQLDNKYVYFINNIFLCDITVCVATHNLMTH